MAYSHARKKRRLSPPEDQLRSLSQNDLTTISEKWSLEQDYERRPRKQKTTHESTRLPVRTADGRLESVPGATTSDSRESSASTEPYITDQLAEYDEEKEDAKAGEHVKHVSTSTQRQEIVQAKEELARLAAVINEDPEEQIGLLRTLAQITSSKNPTITKLGLATQLAVYKDIIPGYRIRPMAPDEAKEKLSKEVKKLRNFEQAIVANYQRYVRELSRVATLRKQSSSEDAKSLATVAISCVCNLLNAVPHFNFRADLLKVLTDVLSVRDISQDFSHTCAAFQLLFQDDDEGNASLEAVTALAKMMKARDYRVNEQVLNLFLDLRLLNEFFKKGSSTSIDRPEAEPNSGDRTGKLKREFRTKKQRKYLKEKKSIEKEFKEADAVVGNEQREQMQAETLKIVFGVYFRVMQSRNPTLMGPVLEGLVRYAHLINQDFFGDLLEALKELIQDAKGNSVTLDTDENGVADEGVGNAAMHHRDTTRETFLCIIAAFALLQGQDAAFAASSLHLDLSFFISHLYRSLYDAAMCARLESNPSQGSPQSLAGIGSPDAKVNVQTLIVLLLRSLQAVLLPVNSRTVPPTRLGAFTKQVMTSSLQVTEKSCTALLGLMVQVLKAHRKRTTALWFTEERKGNGMFDPLQGDVEASNPFATNVWEGELLRWHYAPSVREGVRSIELAVIEA